MQFDQLKRREFITLIGSAAAAWPLAARAQQAAMPVIGFLGANTPSAQSQWTAAFVQRLRELGWIEGRNIAIEYRWAEGRTERFAEIAADFVRLKVDVIATAGTVPTMAAKQATSVIPIVFATATDPVTTGLVASLARPGGNVTGLSNQLADLAGKRIELLREVVPNLGRLAILSNVGSPNAVLEMGEVQAAASALNLEVATFEIRRAEDIAPAFEADRGRAEALYVCSDPLMVTNRTHINTLAMRATALDARFSGVRRSGRSHVLWSKLPGYVAAGGRLCRQDSARGETGRNSRRTADQIQFRRQPQDRESAGADNPRVIPITRRRGDRMTRRNVRVWHEASA
jgi:ABC-type uncharacterized transport system substrate-binding protein